MTASVSPEALAALRELATKARFRRAIRMTDKWADWPTAKQLDADGFGVWFGDPRDDAFVAVASPTTVLALLDELARLEARVGELEDWGRRWKAAREARAGIRVVVGETPPWHTVTEARTLNNELDALLAARAALPEETRG